jgi:hypothetical protein
MPCFILPQLYSDSIPTCFQPCPPASQAWRIGPGDPVRVLTLALSHLLTLCLPDPSDSRRMPSNGYTSKVKIRERYTIVGFISSGTYGRVYKAVGRNGQKGEFAIKKSYASPLPTSMTNL